MTTFYDSSIAPDPKIWLALKGPEQLRLVQNYYVQSRQMKGNVRMPPVLHLRVEENIARGHGPTIKAMTRLQESGLSRHEALCAVGGAVWPIIGQQGKHSPLQQPSQEARINEALAQLNAEHK